MSEKGKKKEREIGVGDCERRGVKKENLIPAHTLDPEKVQLGRKY